MPDVGDTATVTLTVSPYDGTTSATLTAYDPTGSTSTPAASTADGGATWTATVVYDLAGWWLFEWAVTGTGARITYQRAFVPVPPATPPEPIIYAALDLLKEARHIEQDNTTYDAQLLRRLRVASRRIDRRTGRRPGGFGADVAATARQFRTEKRCVDARDGQLLLIDEFHSITGLVVEIGDGTTWTVVTDYVPEPLNAEADLAPYDSLRRVRSTWPTDQVRVTVPWGRPIIPDAVEEATILVANRLYLRKDSPEGVAGSAEWGIMRVSRFDPDVEDLLLPFMLHGFG